MNVKLGYTIEFTAGIWWDNQLLMNNYTATFKMTTVTKNRANHNVALKRLQYLIQAEFTDAVFIEESDTDQIALLRAANVRLLTLPDSPIDQILGMMLYSKCNAVMEDNMVVRSVLISSTASDNVIVEHNDDESYAPFSKPGWWTESGPECSDPEEDNTGDTIFVLAGDPWADIDESLVWAVDNSEEIKNNIDNVVLAFRKDETE